MDARQNLTIRKALFVALLAMILLSIVLGVTHRGQWNIPDEAKLRQNPVHASPQTLDAARILYDDHCERCHGKTGKGDGADATKFSTSPRDLTDTSRMSEQSDGELFYKISEGRKPMPEFKTKLTEEQRWRLVLLIRSMSGGEKKNP
ncbi:MAG TPA: c-type cytochrome [Candidatus Acidoferrum sp.]|jgi:mono/diheme cytochrome c family protein|nr:c-type cytochrome [Candidatus Acidoferrum sp.]